MRKRMLVARLWLEVNSFSPLPTTLADYAGTEWARGRDAVERFRGTPTELAAVADFIDSHPDWEITVSRCGSAPPGGPMEDGLFDQFRDEVLTDLKQRRWDAVYLSLHGALATGRRPAAELDLVAAVRDVIGKTPLGVSLDMHANLGPRMVALIDIAAGYKSLPHLDMRETAAKVLGHLVEIVDGRLRPVGCLARAGHIIHSFNMRTSDGPMMELEAIARSLVTFPVLDVTPFGGFPYADSANTGASVMAYAHGDAAAAAAAAGAVCRAMRERIRQFAVALPDAREGLRRALAIGGGPVAVLESADNTYSGGIGDTPGLLAAMVALQPREPTAFAYLFDPELVRRAQGAGAGARLDCRLGGRVSGDFGAPVSAQATVRRLTDGRFVNRGPMNRGVEVRMGPSAVLEVEGIQVIVTSRREPVNDTAYFGLHGIDVAGLRLLGVKAKNHFRGSFAPLCKGFVEVDTPGPAAIDLRALPYRYADKSQIV
ncbi:MAG: M81 family metallopeptidase [Alphaproteobacteria bacterium]|nr:M81 family metallopeptidase [Alphaproteobacteria bacterium]